MAVNLKQLVKNEDLLSGGHRACAGCTGANILRQILLTAGPDTVIGAATGCMEVVTTIYPYTAWKIPYIHSAFENAAATITFSSHHNLSCCRIVSNCVAINAPPINTSAPTMRPTVT